MNHPRWILKRDLQELVLGELEEWALVTRPAQTPAAGAVEEEGNLKLEETPLAHEAENAPKIVVTLPKFQPLSAESSDSLREARLKIHLARLQTESEERAQA